MKKIGPFLVMLLVMHIVALFGLAGYLVGTGRLDKPKAGAIVDMLRHKGTPDKLREQLIEIMEPGPATSTAPATQTAEGGAEGKRVESVLGTSATDRIDYTRQAIEQERLRLENEAQELRHRQELLEALQRDVQAKLKKVADDKKAFDEQVAASQNHGNDDNFKKILALYDELKPKQVKEIFLTTPVDQVANFLQAMDPSRAAKIIGEFKSPDEKQFLTGVLERIRTGDKASGTGAASGSAVSSSSPAPAGT